MKPTRKIAVHALTRVEGEGALEIRLAGDQIEAVELAIYEPPRFFEALLRGRSIEEVPDITARICGICPIAYQMSSVHALEDALGIAVTPEIRRLRRLLYCGEWISSHMMHICLLNLPDFFGCHNVIELAKQFPAEVNRGMQIKKTGNRILATLGGRSVHPINVRIGGFYQVPSRETLTELLPDLQSALDATIEGARWIATFDFPQLNHDCEFIALSHPDEYPMNEGVIASTLAPPVEVRDYEDHFLEQQVRYSTALQTARRSGDKPFYLGAMARINLNAEQLYPRARALAAEICPALPLTNRFQAILARNIEVVHALEEAILAIEHYRPPSEAAVPYRYRDGYGVAATEAPRGMLFHSYRITDDGTVDSANIVPPTSQNQRQIEHDLQQFLPAYLDRSDDVIATECEKLIRTYDPCISCATHFLRVKIDRGS